MYSETNINSTEFQALPQKYKIQLELKDHIIKKLQNQINEQTEDLLQTKAMLELVKDQFLSLLKKIIQDRKKFPQTIIKTQLVNEYVSNLTIWLDIKLFFLTIVGVFKHSDGAR